MAYPVYRYFCAVTAFDHLSQYSCLGERFAKMEMSILLRTLIQRYSWEHIVDNPVPRYKPVFLRFNDDLHLKFSKLHIATPLS